MLKIKNYVLLCILALTGLSSMAQRSTVRITIEPSDIYIGEQAVINLEVISPLGRQVQFPVYADTLIKGIEVLKIFDTDTLINEVMTLNKKYLITSFDSTLYHIPYMEVIVDGKDTLRTNDLGLKVSTPPLSESTMEYLEMLKTQQADSLDFARLEIADIKDIQSPPFVWTDYLEYILIPLAALLIIVVAIMMYYLWRKKKNKGYFFTPKVIEPPHVIALRELDKLKNSKLSQMGMEKKYYTELTDIIRTYIGQRFPTVNAPEMITDDILEAVHRVTETRSPEEGLEQILKLADLVKFAKYTPLPNENDLSMMNGVLFVQQTMIEEVQQSVDGEKPTDEKINS